MKYNINYINFTQLRFGLTNHGISAQQKAPIVGRNTLSKSTVTLKNRNRSILVVIIAASLIMSCMPFLTKTKGESFNVTLSTSLTVLSTLISVTALVLAIILFDRFGINAKFKEKQLETVFELAYALREMDLTVSKENFTYVNYIRNCGNLPKLHNSPYQIDRGKTLLFPSNASQLFHPFFKFQSNPWLPTELKKQMKFMTIMGSYSVDENDAEKYVKLDINSSGIPPWEMTIPKFTFEMFSINLHALITSTVSWISHHSDIKIEFDILNEH